MKKHSLFTALSAFCFSLTLTVNGLGSANEAKPTSSQIDSFPKTKAAGTKRDGVLWDAWYTVTLNGKGHYGYYNDHFEAKQGKYIYQNHYWKLEEGFNNEEQLGAFAQQDSDYTPLFFSFHSSYRSNDLTIDGNVQTDGKVLIVKARRGKEELPVVKRTLSSRALLSGFFPLWLSSKLPELHPQKVESFSTIMEDALDLGFSPVSGRAYLAAPDDFARSHSLSKIDVNHNDRHSIWYLDRDGIPARIDMPEQHIRVERVTEAAAKKFLSP